MTDEAPEEAAAGTGVSVTAGPTRGTLVASGTVTTCTVAGTGGIAVATVE